MHPLPTATGNDADRQDVTNRLLAAALQTRATLETVRHAATLTPDGQPQAAADLDDAATALQRIYNALLHAADYHDTTGEQH